MQIEPMPPLNTLVAFECVARYCSFSRAADELSLSQSAISRQILQLEEMLGCKLFQRVQRRVMLTPRGEAYAGQVRQLLSGISLATAEVMGWSGLPQVTLACTSAMATLWLSPRLSALHRMVPELQVRLKITDSFAELKSSEFDLAVFYLRDAPPEYQASVLFDEVCYALCAPSYLPRLTQPGDARHLLEHQLLIQDDPQREWTGWRDWFLSQGVAFCPPHRSWRANNYPFLVQAAVQGDGILLGWEGLVQDYISRGDLVPAHPGKLTAAGKCYLLLPQDRFIRPVVRRVCQWLHESVA